jgi:hypothetical protein
MQWLEEHDISAKVPLSPSKSSPETRLDLLSSPCSSRPFSNAVFYKGCIAEGSLCSFCDINQATGCMHFNIGIHIFIGDNGKKENYVSPENNKTRGSVSNISHLGVDRIFRSLLELYISSKT